MKQIYEKKLTKTKAVLFYILQIIGRQEWIRLGIRDRIILFFVNPDTCNSYEFKIHYFGLDYKGNLNNFIDWNVYFYGGYEKNALKLIKELLNNRSNPVCLDI